MLNIHLMCNTYLRRTTDRAFDFLMMEKVGDCIPTKNSGLLANYGSEGSGFESLRAHQRFSF